MAFDKQQFWVIFKHLPEEFMNVYVVNEMGKMLGEVKELDPEDAKPVDSNDVGALIEIDISKSLIRGVPSQNAADCTQWITYYYQKQPHQLCPACFIIDHNKDEYRHKAKEVRDLSQKIVRFLDRIPYDMTRNEYWNIEDAPTRISPKKNNKNRRANMVLFVRPEDGQCCHSVYHEPEQVDENSNVSSQRDKGGSRSGIFRRFKRTREGETSRVSSNQMTERYEEGESSQHQMHNDPQMGVQDVGDWDKYINKTKVLQQDKEA